MAAALGAQGAMAAAGATARATSVRRRLMLPDVNVSPKSKRPPAYVQPGETPLVQEMSTRALTNEVIQQKNAIEAIHVWVKGIADAVDQHATGLDGLDVEIGHIKGKLARYEQTMSKGLLGAEEQLNETFAKLDSLVGELRAESTVTTAALAARAAQLEQGMAALQAQQALIPPGLPQQQQQQPGMGLAGARDHSALTAVVTELSQVIGGTRTEVGQHHEMLANLKATSSGHEKGILEVAGRVLALEEYCKSRPMGEASGTQGVPAETFDPWAASANARANGATGVPGQGGQPQAFTVSSPPRGVD